MGINSSGVKLLAFALGASLAGLAGTVSAHVTYSVVPDPYSSPAPSRRSASCSPPSSSAAWAPSAALLGAACSTSSPRSCDFLQDYELLAFGIALILIMRFRPEGIVPTSARQLEFHEHDQRDAATGTRRHTAAVAKAGATT